jgi:hypothetical protein
MSKTSIILFFWDFAGFQIKRPVHWSIGDEAINLTFLKNLQQVITKVRLLFLEVYYFWIFCFCNYS